MSFGALLQRIQKGVSAVELVHTSHPRWPLPPSSSISPTVHISVLDSSFNPPTLAHLALANTPPHPSTVIPPIAHTPDFDARLLLLSVRNVDKYLKPGDATYEQRMEMMVLLAKNLAHTHPRYTPSISPPSKAPAHDPNVAVAIIDEPTFVGKSAILLDFLCKRIAELQSSSSSVILPSDNTALPSPKLTFLMGTDTVVRLFASRYYNDEDAMAAALHRFLSPDENDSRIICARRTDSGVSRADVVGAEAELSNIVKGAAPLDRITFVDIGEEECTYSSSAVREGIANHNEGWRSMVLPDIARYIGDRGLYTLPS